MIQHVPHAEIDKKWWDQQLLACGNRMWYAQSWVLDRTSPGWDALIDHGSGAIMPLTWRRKFSFKYLFQPYGSQQLGVFSPHYSKRIGEEFLHAIPSEFKLIDIALNEAMIDLQSDRFTITGLDQQVLPLDRPIDELRAGYSKGHRRNLKDRSVEVEQEIAAGEFTALFKSTTAKRFKSGTPMDHAILEQVIEIAIGLGQCSIHGIRSEGKLIAVACFMEWEGRSIFYKSAADPEFLHMKPMFRITDHYIAMHAGSGIVLDFAGSNTASVARFNSGFGAVRKVYLRLQRNSLPPPFKWFK